MSRLQTVEENALFPRKKKITCLLILSTKFAEECMPNLYAPDVKNIQNCGSENVT